MAEITNLIPDLDLAPQMISESDYDPITALIAQDAQLDTTITSLLLSQRPSMVAVAALMAQRVAIGKELLKYRYRPAAAIQTGNGAGENPVISISM